MPSAPLLEATRLVLIPSRTSALLIVPPHARNVAVVPVVLNHAPRLRDVVVPGSPASVAESPVCAPLNDFAPPADPSVSATSTMAPVPGFGSSVAVVPPAPFASEPPFVTAPAVNV